MTGYSQVNLKILVGEYGEERVKNLLSVFSCPLNPDVEQFIKDKAIEFSKQQIAATHLIYASYKKEPVLVGYFTLANKSFHIKIEQGKLGSKLRRKINKFGQFIPELKRHCISAPLIGQIGKNYADNLHRLITGDELLKLACQEVASAQLSIGGKLVYLECEEKPKLLEFYSRNGFYNFGTRPLEADETQLMHGEYLVQMLKYID